MVTYIKITGFKSFHEFEMEFAPFTVLAGLNAAGKSNLFDALELLSRLAETDLKTAFSEQRGEPGELFTNYGEQGFAEQMSFELELLVNPTIKDNWGGESTLKYTRLKYKLEIQKKTNTRGFEDLVVSHEHLENIKHNEDTWIKKFIRNKDKILIWRPRVEKGRRGTPYIYTEFINGIPRIVVPQDGTPGGNKKSFPAAFATQTVLSSINSVDFPHVLAAKEELRSWKFLQLNPEDLREPTKQDVGMRDSLTSSGRNLAAVLYRIWQEDNYSLKEISRKLNSFLPNFTEVKIVDDKANRQYIIKIIGEDGNEYSSRVLSEGTLRLLTLCILQYDESHTGLLCFEEPENGIHPFRIESMVHLLRELSANFNDDNSILRQVIVNTHSPVLLSCLLKWKNDTSLSILFFHLNTIITEIKEKRIKIKITRAIPVDLKKDGELPFNYSPEERGINLAAVKRFLQTTDTESALKSLE